MHYLMSWRILTSWNSFDVTTNFVTSRRLQDGLFDVMTNFLSLSRTFCLHDVFLTLWRNLWCIFGVMTVFFFCIVHCFTSWRNLLTLWFIFDGTMNFLTSWLLFWHQDALCDVIHSFWRHDIFLTSPGNLLTSWCIFKVATNILTLWRISYCCVWY